MARLLPVNIVRAVLSPVKNRGLDFDAASSGIKTPEH
jgi:hypothetical protein